MLSTSKDPETLKNTNEEGIFLYQKNRAPTIQEKTVHQVVVTHRMSSNIYNVKLKFLLNYVLSKESCQCLEIVFALIHFSPKCFAG